MEYIDFIEEARLVFEKQIQGLNHLKEQIGEDFSLLVNEILNCEGHVVLTGIGKSGHIARKISATLSSLGTPSYFLHPAEAVHGDLGIIRPLDLVIAISNSGETEELLGIIPSIKKIGAKLISWTGRKESTLGAYSDMNIFLDIPGEACHNNLAPTTSTTASLVYGDALAIVLSKAIGFKKSDFALFHPQGTLGKKLLVTVKDLMYTDDKLPKVYLETDFREVIFEMNSKSLKMVNVIDENGKLLGIITDGDLRRSLYNYDVVKNIKLVDIYQANPAVIYEDSLAVEALKEMVREDFTYSFLPVVDNESRLKGIITFIDIVKKGINL